MFIFCSCPLSHFRAWHPFHMGGFFIASESRLFPRVHSPPTGYSSGHPWRLVSVSSSQCCRVILSDFPISLKIICLNTYSLSSPCHSCGTLETIFHHWCFSSWLSVVFTIDHCSVDFSHVRLQVHLFTWAEMYLV